MQCERCEGEATETVVTRGSGREELCAGCAVAVWADGQCVHGAIRKKLHDLAANLGTARDLSERLWPDMPVRVFRATGPNGGTIYFSHGDHEPTGGLPKPRVIVATFRAGRLADDD